MSNSINSFVDSVAKRNANEPEFMQAVKEVAETVIPFIENNKNNNGVYKLTFETKPYFDNSHIDTFYPFIEVVFAIKDEAHYHVPITISPYGYSTYKGN